MKTKLISRNPIQRFQKGGKEGKKENIKEKSKFEKLMEKVSKMNSKYKITSPTKTLPSDETDNYYKPYRYKLSDRLNDNKKINLPDSPADADKIIRAFAKIDETVDNINKNIPKSQKKKPHDFKKGEVRWIYKDGKWYAQWTNRKDQNLYEVVPGTRGYDRNGNFNKWDGKKWVTITPAPKSKTQSSNTITNKSNKSTTKSTKTTPSSSTKRTYVDWGDERGKSWTEYKDRLNDIDKGTYAGNDIRFIQEDLNNQYSNNNDLIEWAKSQGYNPEALTTDNIWGSKTEEAYKWYMAWKDKLNQEHAAEQKAKEPYTTSYIPGDYNNLTYKDIANLGFNDYNTLYSWVGNNPDHWFAQDLTKRFGEIGTWDRQNIENNLGISGRYGKNFLGNGDYSDMFNSMKNYFSSYQNVGNQQQQQTNYQPYVSVNIPSYNDLRNNPEVFTGYITNQLNNPYRRIFKKGGIVSKNPVKRFREGNKIEKFLEGSVISESESPKKFIVVKGKVQVRPKSNSRAVLWEVKDSHSNKWDTRHFEYRTPNPYDAPQTFEYSVDGRNWKDVNPGQQIISEYTEDIDELQGYPQKDPEKNRYRKRTTVKRDTYSIEDNAMQKRTQQYSQYGYENANNLKVKTDSQSSNKNKQSTQKSATQQKSISTNKNKQLIQKPVTQQKSISTKQPIQKPITPQKSIYQINYENAMRKYPYLRKFKNTRALQRFLNQNGANLKEDNLFGRKTERALQNFLNGIKFNSPEFTRENTMYLDEISFKPELRHEDDAYKNYELADYMDEEQLGNMVNEVFNKTFKKGGIISRNPIQRFKQNLTKIKF